MDFSGVNERVVYVRESNGMNQDSFAKRLGLTKSAISGYETGRRTPSDAVVKSIAREFNVNEEWLKTGNGSPGAPEQDDTLGLVFEKYHCSNLEQMIVRSYFQLSEDAREKFCEYCARVFGGMVPELEPPPETPEEKAARLERENQELQAHLAETQAALDASLKEERKLAKTRTRV